MWGALGVVVALLAAGGMCRHSGHAGSYSFHGEGAFEHLSDGREMGGPAPSGCAGPGCWWERGLLQWPKALSPRAACFEHPKKQ